MGDIEQVKTDAEKAKATALKAVNAEDSWIERHPALTGWIVLGLVVGCIILAIKGCA